MCPKIGIHKFLKNSYLLSLIDTWYLLLWERSLDPYSLPCPYYRFKTFVAEYVPERLQQYLIT